VKHFAQLCSFLILGVVLPACSERTDSGAAQAYRLAHAPVMTPPTPRVPAAPEETPAAEDTELNAFEEMLRVACRVAAAPITTLEMVAYSNALEACAEKRIRALLARLRPERRATLLRAAEPPHFTTTLSSWYAAWASFRTGTCLLQDAQEFAGYARTGGTMRAVTRAGCRSFSTQRALYWLESLEQGKVGRFARYVRGRVAPGRRTEADQLELTQLLQTLEVSSPETAIEDDHCPICRLGDADFRRLLRAQQAVQATATGLAEATCRTWPELEAELGGHDACRSQARASWLSEAGNTEASFDSARWILPEPGSDGAFPPGKDRDYGAFVAPLYSACETTSATPDPETKAACLKRQARGALPALSGKQRNGLERIDTAWQTFAHELCRVDGSAASNTTVMLAGYGQPECRLLQTARGEFLASTWARGDVNALHRHILARRAWATRANTALANLPSAKALLRARHDFAQVLCAAWPGLDDTTETCTELLELHLPAYGQHLGALSSEPAAPAAAP
jgi:hypothetical protein